MARKTVDELLVLIDASTDQLRREMQNADRQVDRFTNKTNRRFGSLQTGLDKAGASMRKFALAAGTAGAAIAAGFAANQIRGAVRDLAALGDTADKLGLTAEALQELRFAGEEVGVAVSTTDMAIQRFTRRVGEAAQGTGELKDTLDRYGIAVRNADGSSRDIIDVLGDLADEVKNAESEQEQLRIAFKAFDSEGAALVTMLRQGRDGMDELRQSARDLGVVVEEDLVNKAQEVNREWERLITTIGVKFKTAVLETIDFLDDIFGEERRKAISRINDEIEITARKLSNLQEVMDRRGIGPAQLPDQGFERFERLRAQMRALQAERDALLGGGDTTDTTPGLPPPSDDDDDKSRFNIEEDLIKLREAGRKAALEGIEANRKEAESIRLTVDATHAYTQEAQRLSELLKLGFISQETFNAALDRARDRFDEAEDAAASMEQELSQRLNNTLRESINILLQGEEEWEKWANIAIKAIDDVVGALQKGNQLPGSGGIGGLIGAGIAGFFNSGPSGPGPGAGPPIRSARGNVVDSSGARRLNRYQSGGVARSPQVALFGEGSKPEAFVPLPDGRSIPVTISGGGGVQVANHFQIDARGAAPGVGLEVERAIARAAPSIVQASVERVKAIQNRTGSDRLQ